MSKFVRSVVCVVMCTVLLMSIPAWTSAAKTEGKAAVQPRYSYTFMTSTGLEITTSGTAYCTATAEGYDNITTKIYINMKLQQYIALQWTTIAEWEGTFNDVWGAISETKQVYTGRYRVKADFTVYSGSSYETINTYSQEKYITVTP